MNKEQLDFLNQYLAKSGLKNQNLNYQVQAEYFCADEYNANECARLVNQGIKTASCGLVKGFEIEKEPFPEIGQLSIVLNWDKKPVCIIKYTDVSFCPFDEVPKNFAKAEGEGDGSYEWWKKEHIKFFTEDAKEINAEFTEKSEIILLRFEKVHPLG